MLNILFVIIGIVIFGYSLTVHVRFLALVKKTPLGKWWVLLLVLVSFFTIGYIVFAYWLVAGSESINLQFLKTLISSVFFFGAIFVVITISLINSTVRDLIKEREEIQRLQAEKITLLQTKEAELEKKIWEKTKELEEIKAGLEIEVGKNTVVLQEKIKELEKFNKLTVDRELKMAEMKKELEKLKEKVA